VLLYKCTKLLLRVCFFLLFFQVNAGSQPLSAKTIIEFNNFEETIRLVKDDAIAGGDQNIYRVLGSNERVALSNRLIIKTKKYIKLSTLSKAHASIVKVSTLYEGNSF